MFTSASDSVAEDKQEEEGKMRARRRGREGEGEEGQQEGRTSEIPP